MAIQVWGKSIHFLKEAFSLEKTLSIHFGNENDFDSDLSISYVPLLLGYLSCFSRRRSSRSATQNIGTSIADEDRVLTQNVGLNKNPLI